MHNLSQSVHLAANFWVIGSIPDSCLVNVVSYVNLPRPHCCFGFLFIRHLVWGKTHIHVSLCWSGVEHKRTRMSLHPLVNVVKWIKKLVRSEVFSVLSLMRMMDKWGSPYVNMHLSPWECWVQCFVGLWDSLSLVQQLLGFLAFQEFLWTSTFDFVFYTVSSFGWIHLQLNSSLAIQPAAAVEFTLTWKRFFLII